MSQTVRVLRTIAIVLGLTILPTFLALAEACQLENISVTVVDPTAFPLVILVQGQADGCKTIKVSLACPHLTAPDVQSVTSSGGLSTWRAQFTGGTGCHCGSDIQVSASCADEETTCAPVVLTETLCAAPPPCPAGSATLGVTLTGCVGPGSVTAMFGPTFSPPLPPGCTLWWKFGDGGLNEPLVEVPPPWQHIYTEVGDFTAEVVARCGVCWPPLTATRTVTVLPCCPTVEITDVHHDSKNYCKISFTATTSPPNVPGSYVWDFGDGSSPGSGSGPEHWYSPSIEPYEVKVTFTPDDRS